MTDRANSGCRVATYNVLDPGFGTLAPWDSRRTNVATTIASVGPSIVALQESGWTDVRPGVSVARDVATLTGLTLSSAGFSGDAILFDPVVWSAGDGGHVLLPRGRGDRRRSASWQYLRHGGSGDELMVVATHFSHGPERSRARIRQARRILRLVRSIGRSGVPVLVLGDFNSWEGRSARTPLDAFAAAGYVEAIPKPMMGSRAGSTRTERLDHILVSPGLEVLGAGVADPVISGHASDHRLVWADVAPAPGTQHRTSSR